MDLSVASGIDLSSAIPDWVNDAGPTVQGVGDPADSSGRDPENKSVSLG
jgi:hypothetical protein